MESLLAYTGYTSTVDLRVASPMNKNEEGCPFLGRRLFTLPQA